MKRLQLFEFEDLPWFPAAIRQCMTFYLRSVHRILGTDQLIVPLLKRVLQKSPHKNIVDLCSGAGGPMPQVLQALKQDYPQISITLTDLYPNPGAVALTNNSNEKNLRYRTTSVDAGNVPDDLAGVRTMICSFHHMPPETAKRILTDASSKNQPFCLFEISDNSFPTVLWPLSIFTTFLSVLILTPWVRPFSFAQFFFTYIIPILPLVIAWDGAASNARTYCEKDMQELLASIPSKLGYQWEVGVLRKPKYPGGMIYALGLPNSK